MCPVCAVNAATAVASVTTTGGFASFAVSIFRYKRNARKSPKGAMNMATAMRQQEQPKVVPQAERLAARRSY
jgi:hypothetical protein